MDPLLVLIGLATFLYLLYTILTHNQRPKNFPPGPRGWPLVGDIFALGTQGHKSCINLAKKYGEIIGVRFGSYKFVILNNADDIREAFNRPEFQGRGGYNIFLDKNGGSTNDGVILSEGKIWIDLRRFSLRTLRDFGFGKRNMEGIIREEAEDLIAEFRKTEGTPISTPNKFNGAVLNIVWSIIAGRRYPHDHPQLSELTNLVLDFMKNSVSPDRFIFFMYPAVVRFRERFPFLFPNTFEVFRNKLFAFLRKTIREHKETIEHGNPRDFIDTYLEEAMQAKDDPTSSFKSNDDDFGLIVLLMDFFIAGSETTSTTLTWTLFLLALHPEAQEKVYNEIQTVVGSRAVTLDDRDKLAYVEATMTEVYRVSSLVPMGVAHSVTEDVTFKGYNLPKGTLVGGNVYAVHQNPQIWGDPERFRPERFCSPDEKTFVRSKFVLPFSVGKRQCLGESLARDEFFIFLTNIVQNFKITMPPDEPPHTLEGLQGAVQTPEPHKIILLDRNK